MTAIVVGVLLGLLFVALGAVLAAGRVTPEPRNQAGWIDWQERARAVAAEGTALARGIDPAVVVASGSERLDAWMAELADYVRRVVALSATAPTEMDRRVCRGLVLAVRTVSDVLQHELRVEAVDPDLRDDVAGRHMMLALRESLAGMRAATVDLEAHARL